MSDNTRRLLLSINLSVIFLLVIYSNYLHQKNFTHMIERINEQNSRIENLQKSLGDLQKQIFTLNDELKGKPSRMP